MEHTYQGGTAQIVAGGSSSGNPAVAAMFAAIMSQGTSLEVSNQGHEGGAQNVGKDLGALLAKNGFGV